MKTHEEIEQELAELFDDDYWAEHPKYPVEDWQYEVANDDTRQGYRSWLYNYLANEEDQAPPIERQWHCPNCRYEWLSTETDESWCPKCKTCCGGTTR